MAKSKKLIIIPLGGLNEIGKNLTVFEYDKEIVVLDCGIAFPDEEFTVSDSYSSGSTDMGYLSCIMPVVHPYAGGAVGNGHGNDYYISDPVAACVTCAKWQVAMLRP